MQSHRALGDSWLSACERAGRMLATSAGYRAGSQAVHVSSFVARQQPLLARFTRTTSHSASAASSAGTGEVRPFFASPEDSSTVGAKPFFASPEEEASNGTASNGAQSHSNGATQGDMAHKKSDDVQGPMLDPSAANKNWVKLGATSAAVLATAGASALVPQNLAAFAHVLAYGLWFGGNISVTVNGVLMFKNLPRQTFGKLQAKLFPPYFAIQAGALAVQLATVASFPALTVPTHVWASLGSGLAVTLANIFIIEPLTTQLMFQRYKLENAPERDNKAIGALKKRFGPLHGLSSTFNLVSLIAAAVHGFWLSSQFVFLA